jgi:predicted DNA binding CopG/RHH family protein
MAAKKIGYVEGKSKSALAQIAVRLPQKDLTKIARIAAKEKISVSALMREVLVSAFG